MRQWAEDMLEGDNPDALFMDGLDDAIVGIGNQYSRPGLVVYDAQLIIHALRAQGMDDEEAREYFSFNIAGAWVGEGTPIILERPEPGAIVDDDR